MNFNVKEKSAICENILFAPYFKGVDSKEKFMTFGDEANWEKITKFVLTDQKYFKEIIKHLRSKEKNKIKYIKVRSL